MKYVVKERYDASLTPSMRKRWQFFILSGVIYMVAAQIALRHPFDEGGIAAPVVLFAGTVLAKMVGYFAFGTAMHFIAHVPLMLPVMLLGGTGFYVAISKAVLLFLEGQKILACAILMLRFAYLFVLLLCGVIISWEETKVFLRKRRKLFLPLRPKRETLYLLGCASVLISLLETVLL